MADRAPRALSLPASVRVEIESHLRSTLPDEGCGLLVGSGGSVVRFVPISNADPSPRSFLLDPVEHHRTLLAAEDEGLGLVGVVHSHPVSPAVPSETDVAGALEPEWAYVVVGPMTGSPQLRAWTIDGGVVAEIPVKDAIHPRTS